MLLHELVLVTTCMIFSNAYPSLSVSQDTSGLQNGVVLFLNQCFKDLHKKVTAIDGRCDVVETALNSAGQNASFPADLLEIKTGMDIELGMFSKTLNKFEYHLRRLRTAKDELQRRAERTTPIPTTTTTTAEEEEEEGSTMQGDGADVVEDYYDDAEGVAVSCPPGWITIVGFSKCYYVSKRNEKANWKSAKNFCLKRGGKLVEIKTDAEAMILKDAVIPPLSVYHYAYVGRRRMPDSNTWVFLSNEEPVDISLRSWHKPEITTRNDCGCVSRDTDFDMADCVCSGVKMYFICEK
ncbi:uncharacterized protein LOC117316631 [Pecten maximus]|uniref:uncharacterized protein LOC117316631 n=1 Tax=Pecten maximus TaxID=6579 RepID=UPI001458119F|nr:uncharacterized protein LOC117316631 [Pecten maximus]